MDISTVEVVHSGTAKPGIWAEFSNVAVACAKRVMVASQNGAVDNAVINQEFDVAEQIESKASGRALAGKKKKDLKVSLNARQSFAALRIAFAFRSHKFREKVR